jgi:hypothetical protein
MAAKYRSVMRRELRPAFVITLAALIPAGCKKAEQTGSKQAAPSASSPLTTASDQPLRRRSVRAPVPKPKTSNVTIDWRRAERLNGKDGDGRWIYAAADGSCYVRLLRAGGAANPPGVHEDHARRVVDCPESMLDPAWDTCLDDQLTRTVVGNDECVCDRHANPPPPPSVAECPKTR